MRPSVVTESLGKRYELGEGVGRSTLREAMWQRLTRGVGPREHHWAVRDLSLTISPGETVGLIGRNGAGKSTLLRLLARITEPTEGGSRTRGRVASLLEVGTGLHPELTGHENIYLAGAILGMRRHEIAQRYDAIVAFAEIVRFLHTPVKRYSSGMYLRLAFAVAAHLEADVLLVDEALAVGDADFQDRCLTRIGELGEEGRTIIFASHDLDAVSRLCPRTVWLDGGRLEADGPSVEVVPTYLGWVERQRAHVLHDDPSAPVAIHRVSVDGLEESGGRLTQDAETIITVEFAVREPARGRQLGITVTAASSVRVLDETVAVPDRRGSYRATLRIPPVLQPGSYVIGLWVGTAYEDHVWIQDAARLHLVGDTQGRPNRVLHLGQPWDVEALH